MLHQSVAKTPSDITPWSWADPLIPVALRWDELIDGRYYTAWTSRTQVRHVRIDRPLRTEVVGVQTTERYRAIADVLSKPVGDFQASRFFEFPAMLDTKAVAQIVEAVRSSAGTKQDEAAYLRCMLLGEIVASGDTLKLPDTCSDSRGYRRLHFPHSAPRRQVRRVRAKRNNCSSRPVILHRPYDTEGHLSVEPGILRR
ncbi:hypothetical protein MRX96_033863 [Rhipicephalus microplus]